MLTCKVSGCLVKRVEKGWLGYTYHPELLLALEIRVLLLGHCTCLVSATK